MHRASAGAGGHVVLVVHVVIMMRHVIGNNLGRNLEDESCMNWVL